MEYKHFIEYSIIESLMLMLLVLFTPRYIAMPMIVFAYIGFVYVITRLLNQNLMLYRRVRMCEYVKFDNFEEDNNKRLELYKNITMILFGMLFMVSPIIEIMKMSNDMQIRLLNYNVMLIVTMYALYLILKFKGEIITTIMILSSSILGFFILVTTILIVISSLLMLLEFLATGAFSFYSEFTQLFTSLGMLTLFIAKDFVYFWFNLGIAVLVQCIIITIRPPYMMTSTKFSFKIVSMIFTIVTVFLFFFLDESFEIYKSYTSGLIDNIAKSNEFTKFFGSIDIIYNKEYFNKVIKGITIPYTIGSLIGLYLLDIKENKNNSKAKKFLINSLSAIEQKSSSEKVHEMIRKTIYYGGSSYINIILCSSKFEPYLIALEYHKLFESKKSRGFWVRAWVYLTSIKEKLLYKV